MTSDRSRDWDYRLKCNIRAESGGKFLDLAGGGGQYPPVIGWDDKTWTTNINQHWHILSSSHYGGDRVIIKSDVTGGFLISDGHGQPVRCEKADPYDEKCHWHLEGGDLGSITDDQLVRFRSVRYPKTYIDLAEGGANNGAPFITYEGHGGPNQTFRLWKR